MTEREALKLALEFTEEHLRHWTGFGRSGRDVVAAIKKVLAQPEQKPVAIGEEWKPCVKLPIVVYVREQRKGETHVSTREGITPVKEDDLIMRGVAGEEYPIGRELFHRTYTFDTAQPKREPAPVQEPVAKNEGGSITWLVDDWPQNCLLYTTPQPKREAEKQEPKFVRMVDGFPCITLAEHNYLIATNQVATQREWVGLTKEEVEDIEVTWEATSEWSTFGHAVRYIEAALKEKNK